MSAAVVCLALVLLVLPMPVSRRRFSRVFGTAAVVETAKRHHWFRVAGVCAVATAVLLGVGSFIAAAVATATIGHRVRRAALDRKHGLECAHLLDALEAVIGELRVGAHPSAAAESAAGEAQGAAAAALTVSAARSRLGGSGAEGLRCPDAIIATELERIADAWQLAEHHGLPLAELLAAARADLLGRIRFRTRTTAALAGPRATATVLACLPLLGLALGHLMGAAPLPILFTTPTGTLLLPLGTTLACVGVLWTDTITRKVFQ